MELMLKTQRIITAGQTPLDVMVPATEDDAEIFEKFRPNTWYKSNCTKPRNPEFHDKGMSLVRLMFKNQEKYATFDDLLVELKIKAGWYNEHIRSTPASPLLESMWKWSAALPAPIKAKLRKYIEALRKQEMVVYIPKSISFGSMDELDFQQFYNRLIDIALEDFNLGQAALDYIGARKYEPEKKSLAEGSHAGV